MRKAIFALVVVCSTLVISWALKVFYLIWLNPKRMEKYLRKQGIKGSTYKLLVGNFLELAKVTNEAESHPMELSHKIVPRVVPFIYRTIEKYGKTTFAWYGPTPRVVILDPEVMKDIMTSQFRDFPKPKSNSFIHFVVTGLATHEGEQWTRHRKILNPAFHLEKLKLMLPAFHTTCSELISKWEKLVSEKSCEVDVCHDFDKLSGDVISRTAFGSNFEQGRRIVELLVEQLQLAFKISPYIFIPGLRFLPITINKRLKETDREIRFILKDIINQREKAMNFRELRHNDVLGLLMESNLKEMKEHGNSKNAGMTLEEVMDECKLFYLAGQSTASALMVWTMVLLSMHQEWQVRAREEVVKLFGKRKPEFEELNQLKIVTMIFYEVLRLYPPVPLLTRVSTKEVKLKDICLPAGVEVDLPIVLFHHDCEFWGEDAEEFNPERFSEGISKATKNNFTFFPFGGGPKICIGQNFAFIEVKLALSMILQHFSFELSPSYTHAPYSCLTLHAQHGAPIILHKL